MSGVRKQVLEKQKSIFRSGVQQRNVPPLLLENDPSWLEKDSIALPKHASRRNELAFPRQDATTTFAIIQLYPTYCERQILFLVPNLQLGNKKEDI
ncbi:hypothetical protein V1478_004843 [Vespula squamosa]|uniref:Uncharacterized protein n=1 Tax=Vespula squamosa TaxID=30214 RepID=A0ABD2BFQ5_VESSQ